MTTIYGSEDTWPVHKKAYWRAPLELAQAAGWTLTYLDAPHTFGHVACPTGQHRFKVDSTANGASFFAAEASKTIERKCRHGVATGAGKVQERVQNGRALLDRVDEILDSTESDLAVAEAYQGAWAIVEDLEALSDQLRLRLATATATLTYALRGSDEPDAAEPGDEDALVSLADELTRVETDLDAELALADSLGHKPDTDPIANALTEASDTLGNAEQVADALRRRPALAAGLHERAGKARARISHLEGRLVTVQERSASADG